MIAQSVMTAQDLHEKSGDSDVSAPEDMTWLKDIRPKSLNHINMQSPDALSEGFIQMMRMLLGVNALWLDLSRQVFVLLMPVFSSFFNK